MDFARLTLAEPLAVKELVSFHYFEYPKGYVFEGEEHDFWEFLYVDKGEVEVRADERIVELTQGTIIFHKPGEFHTVRVGERHKPPNLIVVSFECRSPVMAQLTGGIIPLGGRERSLLSLLLQEGFQAFLPPFDNPAVHRLTRNPDAPFASEQAFQSHLEMLLIQLIRGREASSGSSSGEAAGSAAPGARKPSSMHMEEAERRIALQAIDYMRGRLHEQLSLDRLCQAVHLGKSRLKEIFQAQTGTGALDYFKQLKIEEAKTLIRERQHNLTEIAAMLGYGSIHYFSRDFKRTTGMPPSEYARTVKARAEAGTAAPDHRLHH